MNAGLAMEVLRKTASARAALEPGARLLTPRERTLVLLADGQRSVPDLCDMVQGASSEFIEALITKGFLERVDDSTPHSARETHRTAAQTRATPPRPNPLEQTAHAAQARAGLHTAVPADQPRPSLSKDAENAGLPPALAPASRAGSVSLRRSAAATKMHLIDLAERTFSRSQPERAQYFREMLREIRDDESLLLAIDIVLEAVAEVAGEERAQAMRDHLLEAREPN